MKGEEFKILAKSFIKKPDEVLKSLLDDLEKCSKIANGYEKVIKHCEENDLSEENIQKQLKTSIKTVKSLCEMNRRMALVIMVYVAGNNFTSDSAHVMMKLGDEEEALKEMFLSKTRGR